jgi:hypothetical protein
MRYYIASGLDNAAQVKVLKAILDDRGWEHTYDWTAHGAVFRQGLERLAEVAQAESEGVFIAEVVIVLLAGGRGTHTELGMAVGQAQMFNYVVHGDAARNSGQRRIVIYSPDPERDFEANATTCAFYHHPLVERFTSWDEMLATFDPEN